MARSPFRSRFFAPFPASALDVGGLGTLPAPRPLPVAARVFRAVSPLILACAACFVEGEIPSLKFERFSIERGLSQSIVPSIAQDRKGFMWFATENGLNRFDGYSFKVFRPTPGKKGGICHNHINCLMLARDGTLWVGTFNGGVSRLDPSTGVFQSYLPSPGTPGGLSHGLVRAIIEDGRGFVWVGTEGGGLNRLDPRTGEFTVFRHEPGNPESLGHNYVYSLCETRDGAVWAGTRGGGLSRLDPRTGRFSVFRHDPKSPSSLAHDDVYALVEDSRGTLWVGTHGGGLDEWDPTTRGFRHHAWATSASEESGRNFISSLFEDRKGLLWVGTNGGGLHAFDRKSGRSGVYLNDPRDPNSLSRNEVVSVFEDAGGILWAGTYGGGVNRCDPYRKQFRLFRHDPDNPESIGGEIVWTMLEDRDGDLWVGTHGGGLDRLDHATGKWAHYRHSAGDPASLSNDRVRVVVQDRDGAIWAGTNGGGLNRMDPKTGKCTVYRHDPNNSNSLGHDEIRAILQDSDGILWVGTHGGGLDRLDPKVGLFTHFRSDPGDGSSLGNDVVRGLHEDRRGNLWVATYGGGLNKLNRKTGVFRRYMANPERVDSLGSNFVFSIHEDRNGFLWLGTWGGGLVRFNPDTGLCRTFTARDGLSSDSIYGVLEDGGGRLWMSTVYGMTSFDPSTGKFRQYFESDGLQSNEFNGGAFHRGRSGKFYFGGIRGFNVFRPEDIRDNDHVPSVVLTGFLKLNDPVETPVPIQETSAVELQPDDYFFTLEFAALDYADSSRNRYAYQMEGFDPDWIKTDASRRFASYTNLEPGEYVFRVLGSNNDGVWNKAGASVRVVVHAPYWKTWWFKALLALAGLGALGLAWRGWAVRSREQASLREAQWQARVAESHARALQAENDRIELEMEKARELEKAYNDLKSAQARLVQAEKLASLGQLTAGIAHEIKNPLNFVTNFAELTRGLAEELKVGVCPRGDGPPTMTRGEIVEIVDQMASNAKKIEEHGKRADGIVKSMLLHSRERTGERQPVDVNSVLSQFSQLAYHGKVAVSEGFNAEVILDLDRAALPVTAVAQDLGRAFLNLLGNALDALEERVKGGALEPPPEIRVTTKELGDGVEVRIRDNGTGIPEAIRNKVFNPFFTTKPAGSGTGLGLSLTHDIVVGEHGGRMEVESEEGAFTEFVLFIPRSLPL